MKKKCDQFNVFFLKKNSGLIESNYDSWFDIYSAKIEIICFYLILVILFK